MLDALLITVNGSNITVPVERNRRMTRIFLVSQRIYEVFSGSNSIVQQFYTFLEETF